MRFSNLQKNRFNIGAVCIIIIMIISVYANTLDNEFTNWDDGALILNNLKIRSLSIDGIKNIFDPSDGGTYQPMRVLSYAIDYRIGGFNPFIYHIHNIILHILSSIVLYFFLIQFLPQIQRGVFKNGNFDLADTCHLKIITLTAVLFFAVHPVNVEAVTWLSSRKYVLLAFFAFRKPEPLTVFVKIENC